MRVDVAICTWNRSAMLAQTLERLCELQIPPNVEWQLIVVDNNSTDATPGVLKQFVGRLPIQSVFEPNPGQANARNRAIAETAAEYLIWTDDDVLVDRDWVAAYARMFARHPEAAFFGGPIEPWFEGEPPRWLRDHWQEIANVFAVRQLGETTFAFDEQRVPYGANFAVKVAVQRSYLYDPTLGLRPGSEVRGEETQNLRRLLEAGFSGWWVPDARVQHFVPQQRQSLAYLRRFFIGQGEVQSRSFGRADVPRFLGRPRWLLRRALAAETQYRWSRMTAPPDVWLRHLIEAATAWGHLKASP
jgi:glucosyl-dolichyl phosphate glucuronosyltransferase